MEEEQYNYKMTIAYDGTNYHGWQIQPNGMSIQEKIQSSLQIFLRKEIHVIGSGRTDSGVHATGQVANFKYGNKLDLPRFMYAANGLLPHDIRILSIESVPLEFHSQYSATGKIYHYHLHLGSVHNPFRRLYALHVREKINLDLLSSAAKCFIGTHDFVSFANSAHQGTASYDSIRTIKRLDVIPEIGGIRLEFEGDGFLYKMVRNIVGLLLEIAEGTRPVEDIQKILNGKDRRQAGKAAAPQGLFLVKVLYSEEV